MIKTNNENNCDDTSYHSPPRSSVRLSWRLGWLFLLFGLIDESDSPSPNHTIDLRSPPHNNSPPNTRRGCVWSRASATTRCWLPDSSTPISSSTHRLLFSARSASPLGSDSDCIYVVFVGRQLCRHKNITIEHAEIWVFTGGTLNNGNSRLFFGQPDDGGQSDSAPLDKDVLVGTSAVNERCVGSRRRGEGC